MRRFISVFGVAIAMVAATAGSALAGGCADLSYAEQEGCWKRHLASQARQMRQLVEKRISKFAPEDLNDPTQADAFAQILRRGQSTWEVYRDTECSHLDFLIRRHVQEAIDGCKAELNQGRIAQLRADGGR